MMVAFVAAGNQRTMEDLTIYKSALEVTGQKFECARGRFEPGGARPQGYERMRLPDVTEMEGEISTEVYIWCIIRSSM